MKQLQKQKEDLNRWAKRYREAEKSLVTLKQEIESTSPDVALRLYVERKDSNLQQNKIKLKFSHVQKINSIYNMEFDHWKEMANTGFALLNQLYLLIRSNGKADKEMQDQVSKLYKLCQGRQKVVKFLEDEIHTDKGKDNADLSFSSISDSPIKSVPEPASTSKKRPNSDTESRNGSMNKMPKIVASFKKPKAVKSINFGTAPQNPKSVFKVPTVAPIQKSSFVARNETRTINPGILNSTFDIDTPSALSENAFNIKDSGKFERMEQQTKKTLIDRAVMTLNKENKKFTPKKVPGKMAVKCKKY